MLQFTGYAVICNVFRDNVMKYIAYIEIVVGLGLGIGPLVGSALYGPLEYHGTMYFFGGLNVFTMIMCWIVIPNSLNETASLEEV